jgi:hypothetical protein
MRIIKLIIYCLVNIVMLSCGNSERRKEIQNELEYFLNSKIIIPEDLTTFYTNANNLWINTIPQTNVKMIVYHDSLSCTPCNVSHLVDWKDIVIYMEKINYRCLPVFIFTPSEASKHELFELLEKMKQLEYYVLIDECSSFINQNHHLSQNTMFHTFLLDKNNKVVLAGNPLYNKKLWDLYKETIKELIDNDGEITE